MHEKPTQSVAADQVPLWGLLLAGRQFPAPVPVLNTQFVKVKWSPVSNPGFCTMLAVAGRGIISPRTIIAPQKSTPCSIRRIFGPLPQEPLLIEQSISPDSGGSYPPKGGFRPSSFDPRTGPRRRAASPESPDLE